jgi:hypothetical protein
MSWESRAGSLESSPYPFVVSSPTHSVYYPQMLYGVPVSDAEQGRFGLQATAVPPYLSNAVYPSSNWSSPNASPTMGKRRLAPTPHMAAGGLLGGGGSGEEDQSRFSERPSGGRRRFRRRSGVCLFVFHIAPEVTEEELTKLFSQYGQVTSVKIMTHEPGSESSEARRRRRGGAGSHSPESSDRPESRGFGFVNMTSFEDARRAITKLNGSPLRSKYLKVSFKKPKSVRMEGKRGKP